MSSSANDVNTDGILFRKNGDVKKSSSIICINSASTRADRISDYKQTKNFVSV